MRSNTWESSKLGAMQKSSKWGVTLGNNEWETTRGNIDLEQQQGKKKPTYKLQTKITNLAIQSRKN